MGYRFRVRSIKSKAGPTTSSGPFVAGSFPPIVYLQNQKSIQWTSPGGFRGAVLFTATNGWNGAMYANPAFNGSPGSVLYDINLGPLGNITNLVGAAAYSFYGNSLAPGPNIGQAQIAVQNTSAFGNTYVLALSPQVSGFLTESAWVGLPGISLNGVDPRAVPFNLPVPGAADRGLSDIPGNALFGGDWVL